MAGPAVAIATVQATFEGFSFNTFADAKRIARKYDLNVPGGRDRC